MLLHIKQTYQVLPYLFQLLTQKIQWKHSSFSKPYYIKLETFDWMECSDYIEEKQLCEKNAKPFTRRCHQFALVTPHSFTNDTGIPSMFTWGHVRCLDMMMCTICSGLTSAYFSILLPPHIPLNYNICGYFTCLADQSIWMLMCWLRDNFLTVVNTGDETEDVSHGEQCFATERSTVHKFNMTSLPWKHLLLFPCGIQL